MPLNNNQSAAGRLAKLPIVRSACIKLLVLYIDIKLSHPNLKFVCEVLESSVTAVVSPVIVKLEPQISVANHVACRSLDWLEAAFPVLRTPTEQIVATAKNKILEIQDMVSIAANGTMHTAARLMGWTQLVDYQADQSLVKRAISATNVGLDSALILSEALMDRVLPSTEDQEEEAHLLEGFEAAQLRRRSPVRLVSLTAKLCRRIYNMVGSKMQSVQAMENWSRSFSLVQDLQISLLTLAWGTKALAQYLQHQLFSVSFFFFQMYDLTCPTPQHHITSNQDRSCLNAAETSSAHRGTVQVPPLAKPTCRMRRPGKLPGFDNGCNVKECVR